MKMNRERIRMMADERIFSMEILESRVVLDGEVEVVEHPVLPDAIHCYQVDTVDTRGPSDINHVFDGHKPPQFSVTPDAPEGPIPDGLKPPTIPVRDQIGPDPSVSPPDVVVAVNHEFTFAFDEEVWK